MQHRPAKGAQVGQGIFRHQEGAAHIHRHHRVVIGHVGVGDGGTPRDAGTVHHRVNAGQTCKGPADLVFIADVADAGVGKGRGPAINRGDGGAFRLGGLRDGKAQARSGAGYDNVFSRKAHAPS